MHSVPSSPSTSSSILRLLQMSRSILRLESLFIGAPSQTLAVLGHRCRGARVAREPEALNSNDISPSLLVYDSNMRRQQNLVRPNVGGTSSPTGSIMAV